MVLALIGFLNGKFVIITVWPVVREFSSGNRAAFDISIGVGEISLIFLWACYRGRGAEIDKYNQGFARTTVSLVQIFASLQFVGWTRAYMHACKCVNHNPSSFNSHYYRQPRNRLREPINRVHLIVEWHGSISQQHVCVCVHHPWLRQIINFRSRLLEIWNFQTKL